MHLIRLGWLVLELLRRQFHPAALRVMRVQIHDR